MRALLDTHTFLWTVGDDDNLSALAREFVRDPANDISFSCVSAWEIAIKYAKSPSHLALPEPPDQYIPERLRLFNFRLLDIQLTHVLGVATLPAHHRDPFDRLLIAQSQVERIPIITSDPNFARYEVEVIW